jgi:hypothetical protein
MKRATRADPRFAPNAAAPVSFAAMATQLNIPAGEIGVIVLQAGTPESLEAVTDKWLDTHLGTDVISMDLQVNEGTGGSLFLMVVYKKDRRPRR